MSYVSHSFEPSPMRRSLISAPESIKHRSRKPRVLADTQDPVVLALALAPSVLDDLLQGLLCAKLTEICIELTLLRA